mgnify:FL=1
MNKTIAIKRPRACSVTAAINNKKEKNEISTTELNLKKKIKLKIQEVDNKTVKIFSSQEEFLKEKDSIEAPKKSNYYIFNDYYTIAEKKTIEKLLEEIKSEFQEPLAESRF